MFVLFRVRVGKEKRDIRLAQIRMQVMVQPLRDLLDSLTEEEARRQMRLNDALKVGGWVSSGHLLDVVTSWCSY